MISEAQARKIIQGSPIFHAHWSSKCQNWLDIWKALKELEPRSVLNVGVGAPPYGQFTDKWINLLRGLFPSIFNIEHLEIDKKTVEDFNGPHDITLGDVRLIDKYFDRKEFDLVFWCQGPEHIARTEWRDTFRRIKIISRSFVVQCPWGSHYNYDPGHISPSIRRGELEALGLAAHYNGTEDTNDAGIYAYWKERY